MKKFALYTAIIGGYDNIRQPAVIDDRFDYYIFTDNVEAGSIGIWKLKRIPYTNSDNKLISGFVKTHPQSFLPNYKATLWIDSSITILDNYIYDKVNDLYNSNIDFASVIHPLRDCIYKEAYAVMNKKYEIPSNIYSWCHKLYVEGYPNNNGLFETGILYRKNNILVNEINDKWWLNMSSFVRRDQLTLNYCLWNTSVNIDSILPQSEHCRNSSHFSFVQHRYGFKKKYVKLAFSERFKIFIRNRVPNANVLYKLFYKSIQTKQNIRKYYSALELILCIFYIPVVVYFTLILHYEQYKKNKQ